MPGEDGIEKAAILLVSLGEEQAAEVLKHLGPREVQKIGHGVTGGVYAAPIFLDYMKKATEGWEAKEFKKPEGMPANIADLAGGSSLFGSAPKTLMPGMSEGGFGGADRAGEFFEEDFESFR